MSTTVSNPSVQPRWWPPAQGAWTVADYEHLPDDGPRYEIIQGSIHMSPAPMTRHQRTVSNLGYFFARFLRETGLGEAIVAPYDVELSEDTIVQPDVVVVAAQRASIITERRIVGVPDLVAEVLSPSTRDYDRGRKFELYRAAGVREIWFVDPEAKAVEVFVPRGGVYVSGVYRGEDVVISEVLPGFSAKAAELVG